MFSYSDHYLTKGDQFYVSSMSFLCAYYHMLHMPLFGHVWVYKLGSTIFRMVGIYPRDGPERCLHHCSSEVRDTFIHQHRACCPQRLMSDVDGDALNKCLGADVLEPRKTFRVCYKLAHRLLLNNASSHEESRVNLYEAFEGETNETVLTPKKGHKKKLIDDIADMASQMKFRKQYSNLGHRYQERRADICVKGIFAGAYDLKRLLQERIPYRCRSRELAVLAYCILNGPYVG